MKTDTIQIHTTVWLPKGKGRGEGQIRKMGSHRHTLLYIRLPGVSDGKQPAYKAGDLGSDPWAWEDTSEGMATHPALLPGEFH